MKVTEPKFRSPEPQPEPPAASVTAGLPPYPSHFETEKILVTPTAAQGYLDTMYPNRTLSRVEVETQEANLRDGTWFPEISPVFLDKDKRAYDGQHRFQAIVNTGISAYMVFIVGVSEEASKYIDTGRKRTYADMLNMADVPDYRRQSVMSKMMAAYELHGVESLRFPGRFPVPQHEKDKFLNTDQIMKSIHAGESLYRATGCNGSWAGYAIWRTGKLNEETGEFTVDPWWEGVRTGAGLEKGDPALALRNWLQGSKRARRTPADRRLTEHFAYAACWNKHVTGNRLQSVSPPYTEHPRSKRLYFAAASVPDFLDPEIGEMSREQLQRHYTALKNAR